MVGMSRPRIERIDVKTGLTLQEWTTGGSKPQTKAVEHSYLEHWLRHHGLSAEFWTGRFYRGVNDADRERLESEGKVLAFTHEAAGYFTDAETARLMHEGDNERQIAPLYANTEHSPHQCVAYGGLLASSGQASTTVEAPSVLVVDDAARSHGSEPLMDEQRRPIPASELESLYDKLGDGTMLVSRAVMASLQTTEAGSAGSEDSRWATRTVSQFRAATPDWPGMMKGTLTTSEWCERLGVAAIITTNAIKGADAGLRRLGLKTFTQLWINRKTDGRYGEQSVGPQVKGCIPEATRQELNPRQAAQAEELTRIAGDLPSLAEHYLATVERRRACGEALREGNDWLYAVLKADERYHQLTFTGFSKVNREFQRYLQGRWQETALSGVRIPSAMAQPHGQLKPWEVCNRDLPHGVIVAYYRSPLPNVGAMAIGINNTSILRKVDREAFEKSGVAYLSPWTAKGPAITDFDGDCNGFFVGYRAKPVDLPEQIRGQLAEVASRSPAEQYEAARALMAEMIAQSAAEQAPQLVEADYPVTVREIIDRTAPERRPPEIGKQPKVKHVWLAGESHAEATWRAWGKTADSPIGKVANLGMALRALGSELAYATTTQGESLLRQVSAHVAKQLRQAEQGRLRIPDDAWLNTHGFPAYGFKGRMQGLARAASELDRLKAADERTAFIQAAMKGASHLFWDVVEGLNAWNLQTAVDAQKSAQGIDEGVHRFLRSLAYKPYALQQQKDAPTLYTNGEVLLTNTAEPISWGVEAVNMAYTQAVEPLLALKNSEAKNEVFRGLFPRNYAPAQEATALEIAGAYNGGIRASQVARARLRERRPADQQPTLRITSPSGNTVVIENLQDAQGVLPIWRASGDYPNWSVTLALQPQGGVAAALSYRDEQGDHTLVPLGEVSPDSVVEHRLEQRLGTRPNQALTIAGPRAQIQPPYAQENDADELLRRAMSATQGKLDAIPEGERDAIVTALMRNSGGMGVALKYCTDLICERLERVPEITLTGLQQSVNEVGTIAPGEYVVTFMKHTYPKDGVLKTTPAVAIVEADGPVRLLGTISNRSAQLPIGMRVKARLEPSSATTASLQVLEPAFSLGYSPSRQELLQWYVVAKGDQQSGIKDLGLRLKDTFTQTVGDDQAVPPLSYRHASVVMSEGERQAMEAAISAAREGRPAMGPHRQERSREQVEIG